MPQDQWDLIMGSVAASGDLQATDVKTAEMDVQLETGILVRVVAPLLPITSHVFRHVWQHFVVTTSATQL